MAPCAWACIHIMRTPHDIFRMCVSGTMYGRTAAHRTHMCASCTLVFVSLTYFIYVPYQSNDPIGSSERSSLAKPTTHAHRTSHKLWCLALRPDGLRFVSGSHDDTARIAYHGLAA